MEEIPAVPKIPPEKGVSLLTKLSQIISKKWLLPISIGTATIVTGTGAAVGTHKLIQNRRLQTTPPPSSSAPAAERPTSAFESELSPAPTSIPRSPQVAGEIKIIEGNICLVGSDGETKILVDKNDWQAIPIDSFSNVSVSPDGKKMCFLGHTMVPVWLFWSDIDGSDVTHVQNATAKNCVWSRNSREIAFNNHTTDVSPIDVYVYDTQDQSVNNVTASVQEESIIRAYQLPEWAEGDTKIIAKYTSLDFNDPNTEIEGTSVISMTTGEIEDR